MMKFVSSNRFAAKSVEQMRVEQSQFEQFTPTPYEYSSGTFDLIFYSIFDDNFGEIISIQSQSREVLFAIEIFMLCHPNYFYLLKLAKLSL